MSISRICFLAGLWIAISCSPKTTVTETVEESSTTAEIPATIEIDRTEILWDEWGVPHIYAVDNRDLFYSFGWAQMQSHTNLILKIYAMSRGRAAEYWGEQYLQNDRIVHALDLPTISRQWYQSQTEEFKGYIDAFSEGMMDYITEHPEEVDSLFLEVLPVVKEDVLQHALFVLYTRFVGGGELYQAVRWDQMGSNTYAVGPKKSASGNAMLVMNPHLPWSDEWLFYEAHFNTSDLNLYGATLVGLPTLGIAFNQYLGWSHTNNTIDNADRYELTMRDNGYVLDGNIKPFIVRRSSLKVKGNDGKLETVELNVLSTPEHGTVIKVSDNKAIAVKMPGFDRPYGMVQWWRMGNAKSFNEFKDALTEVQIPFFNIMYADKEGNIFYMFNGQVPVRRVGDWDFWSGIVGGSRSYNLWSDVHRYQDLPKIENPSTGWLQNANDPPWTCTFPLQLVPKDYPSYMAPVEMGFRPQRSVRMLYEDPSITFDELVSYKLSTRIEFADRILDDLIESIEKYGSPKLYEARDVLKNWDRHADAESRGMALFYSWAQEINPSRSSNFERPWTIADAMRTPDGLADQEEAVRALNRVIEHFEEANIPLDVPWGEVYRIKYGDYDLPGNGSDGSVGIYRVAWSGGPEENGISYISGGDSWQGVIEFGDRVNAKVLLSYGNSTQRNSPHYGDQLALFSKKELRDCYFYPMEVKRHVSRRETLREGKFR